MKKIIYLLAFIALAFAASRFIKINPSSNNDSQNADIVLFWGNGCSYCKIVKDYIDEKKLSEKVNINQKEVYYNKSNAAEMKIYADKCPEINKADGLGVPFAWINSEQKCLLGHTDIISWLNQKAGISQ